MNNIGTLIERMSEYLDKGRPDVKVITVRARRATVVKFVKPAWWGGPLIVNGREIVTKDPVPRPNPPKKARKKRAVQPGAE
jgi:hypothetical protein